MVDAATSGAEFGAKAAALVFMVGGEQPSTSSGRSSCST